MATCTCGGEIGGYCATGKEDTAMPPASVMTTDSTVAKIGRSMKKWEIMADPPVQRKADEGRGCVALQPPADSPAIHSRPAVMSLRHLVTFRIAPGGVADRRHGDLLHL